MPDFTFTVSLRVEFQTDWTPLLMKQKKTASLSIFLWSGKSGNGEVQWVWVGFTWIKLDGPLFSISLNSDQETTPTLRCVAEFGNAGDGRDSCIQRPPPPSQLEKNSTSYNDAAFWSSCSLLLFMDPSLSSHSYSPLLSLKKKEHDTFQIS